VRDLCRDVLNRVGVCLRTPELRSNRQCPHLRVRRLEVIGRRNSAPPGSTERTESGGSPSQVLGFQGCAERTFIPSGRCRAERIQSNG
jgi:hypothetical protein